MRVPRLSTLALPRHRTTTEPPPEVHAEQAIHLRLPPNHRKRARFAHYAYRTPPAPHYSLYYFFQYKGILRWFGGSTLVYLQKRYHRKREFGGFRWYIGGGHTPGATVRGGGALWAERGQKPDSVHP